VSWLVTRVALTRAVLCEGTANSCLITGNSASYGGGASGDGRYETVLRNCTVAFNSATESGGGAINATVYNSILYFNSAPSDPNGSNPTNYYCCTTPLPEFGEANILGPPLFVDPSGGDSRLQSNSPCIDAGANGYRPTGTDPNECSFGTLTWLATLNRSAELSVARPDNGKSGTFLRMVRRTKR
jgi:hypothetical protein